MQPALGNYQILLQQRAYFRNQGYFQVINYPNETLYVQHLYLRIEYMQQFMDNYSAVSLSEVFKNMCTDSRIWSLPQFAVPTYKMMEQISKSTYFLHLTILSLQKMNLESVEFLSYMNAPNIIKIVLNDNWITNFKQLDKTNFLDLWCVEYDKNFCPSVTMQRTKFSNTMLHLCLEEDQRRIAIQDLSCIAKYQFEAINMKGYKSDFRIDQPLVLQKILTHSYYEMQDIQTKGRKAYLVLQRQ